MGQETVINAADTAWMLTATALVLLMTLPALALFYGGLVQAKNILSVLVQCAAVAALCSVLWFAVGYSLAYSGDGDWLGNGAAFFLNGMARDTVHPGTHIPESVFVMFQMTFAVITPALIIGAYVERIRFAAVLLVSALWLLIVYAPVAHWVWGGGWLAKMGVMDFAGGIVVHVTAGVSALVIAWMIQPRHEFPHGIRPPHAPWMVMVGASLLWVGWFGFNAGSALSSGADAGMAMLATHLSAASATLVWMAIEWIKFGKPSLVGAVTGTIAGLATITPAAGVAGPLGAVLLGAAASLRLLSGGVAGQARDGRGRCAGRAGRAWRGRGAGHPGAAAGGADRRGRRAISIMRRCSNSACRPSAWCAVALFSASPPSSSPSWRICWSGCGSIASMKPWAWISPPMARPAIT